MSPRATALAVAVTLFAASGFFLIALYYAPLPGSWNAFFAAVLMLTVLFCASFLGGLALALLLAVQTLARRVANRRSPDIASPS